VAVYLFIYFSKIALIGCAFIMLTIHTSEQRRFVVYALLQNMVRNVVA